MVGGISGRGIDVCGRGGVFLRVYSWAVVSVECAASVSASALVKIPFSD
jgi:hypothetical protein